LAAESVGRIRGCQSPSTNLKSVQRKKKKKRRIAVDHRGRRTCESFSKVEFEGRILKPSLKGSEETTNPNSCRRICTWKGRKVLRRDFKIAAFLQNPQVRERN